MGAWGPGPFENDAALDFLSGACADPATVEAVLHGARDNDGYLDVDDGSAAVAAAAVVVLAGGLVVSDAPAEAAEAATQLLTDRLGHLATIGYAALKRVGEGRSELASLWGDDPEWRVGLGGLQKELQRIAHAPRRDKTRAAPSTSSNRVVRVGDVVEIVGAAEQTAMRAVVLFVSISYRNVILLGLLKADFVPAGTRRELTAQFVHLVYASSKAIGDQAWRRVDHVAISDVAFLSERIVAGAVWREDELLAAAQTANIAAPRMLVGGKQSVERVVTQIQTHAESPRLLKEIHAAQAFMNDRTAPQP